MEIALLKACDASSAHECEEECLPEAWSERDIAEMASRSDGIYITASENGKVCGIAGAYVVLDEAQITNVAVRSEFRRRGIAKEMLERLLNEAKGRGCKSAYLEVSERNSAAIALYVSLGFENIGFRKGFYRTCGAILMKKII